MVLCVCVCVCDSVIKPVPWPGNETCPGLTDVQRVGPVLSVREQHVVLHAAATVLLLADEH